MVPRASRAFTIIEMLVVIGIVVVLVSLLLVAVNAAARTGQAANTQALMGSIKQALARFRSDVGYLPPVLGVGPEEPSDPTDTGNHDLRRLYDPRGLDMDWGTLDDILPEQDDGNPNTSYVANVQDWFSETTLAEYLIGYGHHYQDGYGFVPGADSLHDWDVERPPAGIRNPWSDGVWGASRANGLLSERMGNVAGMTTGSEGAPYNYDQGQVFGPYLELKDERLLASTDGTRDSQGRLNLYFPGDGGFNPDSPLVLVDYWGNPIRYYRRLYPPGSIQSSYRPSRSSIGVPTLSDVILLRPFDLDPGEAIDRVHPTLPGQFLTDASQRGDSSTTMALQSAEFALFSPGPDRSFNPDLRIDDPNDTGNTRGTDLSNEDNIVELGP